MIFKLIVLIAFAIIEAFFIGFNLDYRCNIWFFFTEFKNVPVFLSLLISFAAGVLITIPLMLLRKKKKLTSEQAHKLATQLEEEERKDLDKKIKKQQKLDKIKTKLSKQSPKSETASEQTQLEIKE